MNEQERKQVEEIRRRWILKQYRTEDAFFIFRQLDKVLEREEECMCLIKPIADKWDGWMEDENAGVAYQSFKGGRSPYDFTPRFTMEQVRKAKRLVEQKGGRG